MNKNKIKTLMAVIVMSSTTAFAMTMSEQIAFDKKSKMDSDIAVYKNYVPNPEDGEMANLANRVYFKMTAPQYFKKGNSLAWKDENASYWKK
jgi:hypothetical protein